ncbi:adenylate/guanylate cyclase domain-containing protein [Treponema sp. OMZ 840]|uniref:CHASE2 domain-containing protein n=1 Tax=Treponema sp. OMZ 840 TaxID=244313 RepID=UPI003D914DFB
MEKQGKEHFFSVLIRPEILICVGVIFLTALGSFAGIFEKLELRMYDILLAVKPAVPEQEDILIVAIDDASIGEIGTFPWSRDILGDALIRMRELGAKKAVFDIEYVSPSQRGIDPVVEKSLPQRFEQSELNIASLIQELSAAVARGDLPAAYAPETAQDLISSYVAPEFRDLQDAVVGKLSRDNDLYFAQTIHFFGDTWLTVNAGDMGIVVSDELIDYVRKNILLHTVTAPPGLIAHENDLFLSQQQLTRKMTPALFVLMEQAQGAGFTNVVLDSDGARRRIELLHESEGLYIPQLVFAPLLTMLQTDSLVRTKNALILKDALFPGENQRKDIRIPLDSNGRMLINWIPDTFRNSFKNESVFFLYDLDKKEQTIVSILQSLAGFRLGRGGTMLGYYDAAHYLLDTYADLLQTKGMLLKNTEVPSRTDPLYNDYFERRKAFFTDCAELTDPVYEQEILSVLDELVNDENRDEINEIRSLVSDKFTKLASYLKEYNSLFAELQTLYSGAVCIIGHTASNSTDLGTTPFQGQYPNIGTHANVLNTILNRSFIFPLPWYVSFGFYALLLFIIVFFDRQINIKALNVIGVTGIVGVPLIAFVLIQFGIYTPLVGSFLAVVLSYIGTSLYRFASAEKDKTFLRRAFSTYLSEKVVDEIVNDPTKLTLGGEEKNITALFTDIKSFSTLSEKVTPVQLVNILNEYLTDLSNIILKHEGTIDKYIGDAIVSFFGAPITVEDHAWQACVAAVRMKEAEVLLNRRLKEAGMLPMPIQTRIGINTGNMVVGNMGTDMKMNYTIMGNDVNLAARLEGVNKSYSSWILASESTWDAANSGSKAGTLLGRRLDRVRVIGIEKPVQLYNIMGVKAELSDDCIECVKVFHAGLDRYLQKDFAGAKKLFETAVHILPEDGPSQVFATRCQEFIKTGVPENWSGVLTMTTK